MNLARPVAPVAPTTPDEPHAKLRKVAHQLEGMFVRQLFAAMREATPQESQSANPGGQMFTSMLDDELANQAAQRLERGIGEALYRQLSRRLDAGATPADVRSGIQPAPGPLPVRAVHRLEPAAGTVPEECAPALPAAPTREPRR